MFVEKSYPRMKSMMKKSIPMETAMIPTILMKKSTSLYKVVSLVSAEVVRLAIYPMTVLSPVLNTTPTPFPFVQAVPKNPTFGLSKMF